MVLGTQIVVSPKGLASMHREVPGVPNPTESYCQQIQNVTDIKQLQDIQAKALRNIQQFEA